MNCFLIAVFATLVIIARPGVATAQSNANRFEVGVQITAAHSSQFDANEVGFGGRVAWRPLDMIGIEAEVDLYPGDFPDDRNAFSGARVEGLFGLTAGWTFDRLRPFARLRPGFLRMQEAPEPLACITIFPPPLACVLGAGRTLFALDIGGGLEVAVSADTFLRIDLGDRLLEYPGPVFEGPRLREDAFFRHDFRFAAGGGVKF